jgi:hypothetical protein
VEPGVLEPERAQVPGAEARGLDREPEAPAQVQYRDLPEAGPAVLGAEARVRRQERQEYLGLREHRAPGA